MTQQAKLDRNRAAIEDDWASILAAVSQAGYYGKAGVRLTVHDGVVVVVQPWTKRERRLKEK